MTKVEQKFREIEKEIEIAIKDAIHNVDFSRHKRKKKVRRGWHSIALDSEIIKPIHAEFIRDGLHFDIERMLYDLKDGKIVVPEFHNKIMSYGSPSWRHQFVASSKDGECHVLVTMEQVLWDLEIAFEIEVE